MWAAVVLAAYGRLPDRPGVAHPAAEEMDERWALFGLPLPLSVDNVVAGTSLGLLGFSPWVAPPLFGAITAVMTFIGLELGRVASRFIRLRSDLLTGIGLLLMALLVGRWRRRSASGSTWRYAGQSSTSSPS